MSMIMCHLCDEMCDSDNDPDGFYTVEYPEDFVCKHCRDAKNLHSQFDEAIEDCYGENNDDL